MQDSNKPASELYLISREHIQHTLMSIETRLLWIMNNQAFMLGIYLGTSYFISASPKLHHKAEMLNAAITYLGLLINLFALIDIIAGVYRMHKLRNNYMVNNHNQDHELKYPPIYGSTSDRVLQGFAPIVNVLFFLMLWSFFILYDHNLIRFH